ncbi:MAG: hemolysin family protein [Lachnospiraceae bacterium]|nr:hemolysin family protein [Lachnospiraceae bacterium]
MDAKAVIDAAILIVLIFLSSFFSSAETGLTCANKITLQSLADEGNKRAALTLKVIDDTAKMLNTILIGNNIVNTAATALTTAVVIRMFGDAVVGVATGIFTVLIIIFGEITPKNSAAVNPEKIAMRSAPVIYVLMIVLTPIIFIVSKISRGLLFLMRVDPDAKRTMTETELRTLVDVSQEDGVIETDERDMINNVVDLSDTYAKEIMIPRIDMTSVPISITYDELIETFKEHHFTRLPVFEDRQENIVGILNMKDLLVVPRENFSVRSTMRQPNFTYEMKNISDLLDEMRLESLSIVIVLDEYGAASGMITMEDVLEEIVGDIHDEYKGRDEEEITEIVPGREYSCLGSVDIDDLNKVIGTDLESEDYDSIGGYVIEHSEDSLPKVGEYIVEDDGTRFIVEAVRKNRIMRVHIYLPEKASEEDEDKENKE